MDTNSKVIYIENFPLETAETTIKRLFSHFGSIKTIDLPTFPPDHPLSKGLPNLKTKGYAFIEFVDEESADKARRFFNNLDFFLEADDDDCTASINKRAKLDCVELDPKNLAKNMEFKRLMKMRVMSKRTYSELTIRYKDSRFKSLVKAAKLLLVT